MPRQELSLFDRKLLRPALLEAVRKLDPRVQWRNPVMFVVYVGTIVTALLLIQALVGHGEAAASFIFAITLWLLFTVLFANFAEALAEGRSRAQAASLRGMRQSVSAKKFIDSTLARRETTLVKAEDLRKGDVVLVESQDVIPADGEVIEGAASVDESAITGESAPVIRESGGDFGSVTGSTKVLSDWIVVRVSVNPGETFLDRMISMVEGAKRQKTPNEIALTILLVALTLVFLAVIVTLLPFSLFSVEVSKSGSPITITALVSLLVCLIPTTIGGLLSAIGVAGMSRMMQANVIATSGRAVEAAGDVDVLLLDKTGTITLGNRQAAAFLPAPGVTEQELADAAQLASLADETPEGRSVVVLAKQRFNLRERDLGALDATFVPFSAHTRMSGVNVGERAIRKGAPDSISKYVASLGKPFPPPVDEAVQRVARKGEYTARGGRRRPGTRGHRVEGYRERRNQRAVRGPPQYGNQDHHDHRRQSPHGSRHRGRGRSGRLPRRGDSGSEAQAHSATPDRGSTGRDDGRRHQRCAGPGAVGRRRRHEYRHSGGQGRPATWSISIRIRPN